MGEIMHDNPTSTTRARQRRIFIASIVGSFLLLATHGSAKEIAIFNQTSSASNPTGSLVADSNGVLYGTASQGGGYGSVFSLTPPAEGQTNWTETVLYQFQGGTDGIDPTNGLTPDGSGGFFGVTYEGGTGVCPIEFGVPGCGTVFHLTPPERREVTSRSQTGWTETILYNFQGSNDGNQPVNMSLPNPVTGVLYGVTFIGGAYGAGTVFALTPPAQGQTSWTESVLHTFTGGSDGGYPASSLIQDTNGALYGTTTTGGYLGGGTVFKLTPPTLGETNWSESVLYSFGGEFFGDAGTPSAALVADASGNLYGPAATGGFGGVPPNAGAIFELSPPSGGGTNWTETILYSFTGAKDGSDPDNAIIMDEEGAIYGTTSAGGTRNNGAVFKLEPPGTGQTAWTFKTLYDFKGSPDGSSPGGGLTPLKSGKNTVLFGVTLNGGTSGDGNVFELTNTGFAP
jgi:uncharacterized repeat protein (TIGR03803 family)